MNINVVAVREQAKLPFQATSGSAGADLFAYTDKPVTVKSGAREMIYTGIAVEIPKGYGGFLFPRSSVACKFGVTLMNCVGVIDSDYRGEISIPLINYGETDFVINHGDRIAQLVILPVAEAEYKFAESLSETVRGTGGFGSTGRT